MALTEIKTSGITADAVTAAKIADDAVGAEHIEQLDADLSFADNVKAKFGAGNDLQIYHDGSDSYIVDSGTGDLMIRSTDDLKLQNADGSESFLHCNDGGDVILYRAGTERLRTTSYGALVSGDLNATGLNVADDIVHTGDTDTKIAFADNQVMVHTAGSEALDIKSDGAMVFGHNDEISFNANEAIRLNIPANADLNNSGNNRDDKGKITIAAGNASQTGNPDDNCTVIQITPEETRSTSVNSKHGGIGWQHLSPLNWTGYQGNQIWMGAALHDTSGQERDNFQIWMNNQTGVGSQPDKHAFNLSPEGYHSFPKLPAFSCHKSTSTSGDTTVIFNQVTVNNGSHYDSSNGRFTAPEDGLYFFSFYGMGPNSTSANTRLKFQINGSNHSSGEYHTGVGYSGGSSYNHVTISAIFSLSASDYITVYVSNNYDDLHDNHMKWNGFKIG